MAHWAEINESNIVIRVIVTDNNDPNGDEGLSWLVENLGGTWIQTSYNNNIRKNFAGVGFSYDSELDAFISPKPYESWVLDDTCNWTAPTPYPTDDKLYTWDEKNQNWILTEIDTGA